MGWLLDRLDLLFVVSGEEEQALLVVRAAGDELIRCRDDRVLLSQVRLGLRAADRRVGLWVGRDGSLRSLVQCWVESWVWRAE